MWVFGLLLVLLIPAAGIAGLVLGILAFRRIKLLETSLRDLRTKWFDLEVRIGAEGGRTPAGPVAGTWKSAPSAPPPPEAARPEPVRRAEPPPVTIPLEAAPPAAPPPPTLPRVPPARLQRKSVTRPSWRGLEEQVGARITVWVGSVALALAGVFLVKYSFDRNLLTPAVRVALGLAFGVTLLGGGEWFARGYRRLAQGFSGAGIAVLYATLLAGVNLYDLISRTAGFALLALTTAAAVGLSLRQGPWIALLGLVGGFLTPAWIGSEEPNPGGLFSYLFLLQVGLIAVARRRRWRGLFPLILLGGIAWAAVWIAVLFEPGHGRWLGPFLLGSVAAFLLALRPGASAPTQETALARALTWASAAAGVVLVAFLVGVAGYAPLEWAFLGILGAGFLVLARLDPEYSYLPFLGSATGMAVLLVWSENAEALDLTRYGTVAFLFGLLYAAGGYAALWGAKRPRIFAALSALSAVGYLLVAYKEIDHPAVVGNWGVLCLGLAALYAAGAYPIGRRRARMVEGETTLAILTIGVTALAALAAPMELERAWITVAWAAEVAAVAWIHGRLRVRLLPQVGAVLAVCVSARLLLNPMVLEYPIGTGLVWNWLLYGYGIPVAAFFLAAVWFRETGAPLLAEWIEAGAVAIGWALASLEVRHYFHPEDLGAGRFALAEWGAFSVVWLLYGWGLLEAARRIPRRPFLWGGWAVAGLALAQAILAQGLAANPLWADHPVGSLPVWNALLFVYGLPALLALPVARLFLRQGRRVGARLAGCAALILLFLLITLQVRQAFHGTDLRAGETANAEWYSYSFAWIVFGTVLLVLGVRSRAAVLRWASLAVMLLAVGKVFLFDTAHLVDLYRVVSFLGLGASLLFLAYVYQRFVFGAPRS